jgi:hypothetical protein
MTKLAIIVPYRDREEHLAKFVPHMEKFLSDKEIDFKIFVVEQGNDRPFNRGWLINVGYDISSQQGFDYFCFHDVDMLPEDDTCDYSWVDKPTHLASRLSKFNYRLVYPEYFSGVTLFNKEHFEWINGFSNKYWGWGFEDDDLLYRCRKRGVPLQEQWTGSSKDKTPRYISTMEFNGRDYLEIKNTLSLNKVVNSSFSVEAWVEPSDDLTLDENKEYDEFHVFTRPGHHVGIAYTSGMQYKGGVWNNENKQSMVVSDRHSNEWSHVVYTVDHILKRLRMYVNGVEVNDSPTDFLGKIKEASNVSYYIGCANPNARFEDGGYFKGSIAQITMWSSCIGSEEASYLYNGGFPRNVTDSKDFDGWKSGQETYKSSKNVVGYWNFDNVVGDMVIDKSGNDNHAKIHGALKKEKELRIGGVSLVPNRRDGKYSCLEHEENGWGQTKFTHWETRENQLRFFNKVRRNLTDPKDDGLSSLKYEVIHQEEFLDKHEFISVT